MPFNTEMIKAIRKKRGLTQEEFAARVGTSQTMVNYWEGGKNKPSYDNLDKIAEVLDVPVSLFFGSAGGAVYGGYLLCPLYGDVTQQIAVKISCLGGIDMSNATQPFAFEITNDNMLEAGLPCGSYAIINPIAPIESGDAVLVNMNGQDIIKWFIVNFDGSIEFRAASQKYPSFPIPLELSEDARNCIIGKVVQVVSSQEPKRAV